MKLKSFGCSFIFGTDLSDQTPSDQTTPAASQLTWPAHLAKYLNLEYRCNAQGGAGNLLILSRILIGITLSNHADLFVIGWTWSDRFDYTGSVLSEYSPIGVSTPMDPDPDLVPELYCREFPWQTILPSDADSVSQLYYQKLHSEFRDKFTSLCYIKLAIDTLNQAGIPFIMTYVDELLFNRTYHTDPAVVKLQNYIKPYMTTFEGQTFLNWSRSKGYPETQNWHPLEEAHQAAADYIINIFDKQNTIDR